MEHTYTIQELRPTDPQALIQSWRFLTSWNNAISCLDFPGHQEQLKRFRWILETHARADPLNVTKASEIQQELDALSRKLSQLLSPIPNFSKPSLVDISDYDKSSTFHSIPWELVENTIPGHKNQAIVRRRVVETSDTRSECYVPETFNILLMAARRDDDNEDYRQAALPILQLIQNLPDGAPLVTIEIVRPGKYLALKEQLSRARSRPDGFVYHLVHLDMHGGLNSRNEAQLFFSDGDVPAASVAKVMKNHGVQYVVVNACESARGDKGIKGNLAKTFVENGIRSVLGMSYQLNVSAVSLLTHQFYDAFLRHNLSFAHAASFARQAMRENPGRGGRFGLNVDLSDWMVPVVYSSSHEDPMLVASSRVSRILRKLPVIFGRTEAPKGAPSNLFGRDADILRMEKKLLENTRTGKGRLLFLDGNKGVGKTSLLRHLQWWWVSTGMVVKPIYIDLEEHRGKSPQLLCAHLLASLGKTSPVKSKANNESFQRQLASISEEFNYDADHLYPRPLIIFDHLWSSDWPLGKRSKTLPKTEIETWKTFFEILSESPAFTIVASHRWPWYLDDGEASEFPKECLYVLRPIEFNTMDMAHKIGGDYALAGLVRSQKNIEHLELILEWCTPDPALLDIMLRLINAIGLEETSRNLLMGMNVLRLPQFDARALERLPTYKIAKKLWRKAPKFFRELLIGFAPFLRYLPRCYESYWEDFVVNKLALLHPVRNYLAKYNPGETMKWNVKILSMQCQNISMCLPLLHILKSMGLVRAEQILGNSLMNSGLPIAHGQGGMEGTKLHSIHPVFTLFLRHKAERSGFLPRQSGEQSRKSLCLEQTFINYHEKRVIEWFEQDSPQAMEAFWDSRVEMASCKHSFFAAMEMVLRSSREGFATPVFLLWCWKTYDTHIFGGGRISAVYLVECTEKALSRLQRELSRKCNDASHLDLVREAAQLALLLAKYFFLVASQRDKSDSYFCMVDELLSTLYFRDMPEVRAMVDIMFPELTSMETELGVLKRIRNSRDSNVLALFADLPSQNELSGTSNDASSLGWNALQKSLNISEQIVHLQSKAATLVFWDTEERNRSIEVLNEQTDDFLTELAPIWPNFLSTLDSEILCSIRELGFSEEDDLVMVSDSFYDGIIMTQNGSSYGNLPSYASIFMAAIRNDTLVEKARTEFYEAWENWKYSNLRLFVLQLFQQYLGLESETLKALFEASQFIFLSLLDNWPLVNEYLGNLVVRERAMALQELNEPQLGRVIWWHICSGLCAFHISSWDLCLSHLNTALEVISQRPDARPEQHFAVLVFFAILQMSASSTQVSSSSAVPALFQALTLGYGSAREGPYACNGVILSILLRLAEKERSICQPSPPTTKNAVALPGVSTEIYARLEFLLSFTRNPEFNRDTEKENFDKQPDGFKEQQRDRNDFPLLSEFFRTLLGLIKENPTQARTIMAEAENHTYRHSRGCGCPFGQPRVQKISGIEESEEILALVPIYDPKSFVEIGYTPRLLSIIFLTQLWFTHKFRHPPLQFFVDETEERVAAYLERWHPQVRDSAASDSHAA